MALLDWILFFIVLWIVVVIPGLFVIWLNRRYPEEQWDWEWTDTTEVKFPENFLWGVATSAHQVEGDCTNNNWWAWEHAKNSRGAPRIKTGEISGNACEHWTRYQKDIACVVELGCNAYRFSIEWSKIEPMENQFDQAALTHYKTLIRELRQQGIEPMVTLHHFTNPLWFEKLGAFEKKKNIHYFVRFAEKVFDELQDQVTYWCTINEPSVYATMGYFRGEFPPGKRNIRKTGVVLRNLLEAHVQVYTALKKRPGGKEAKIGLVKNLTQFDPIHRNFLLDWIVARTLHKAFNTAVFQFLKTGRFRFSLPGLNLVRHYNGHAARSNDFIGLNYYSHFNVKFSIRRGFVFQLHKDDVATDMGYAMYPEGMYRALHELNGLGLPIIITENGIADKRDDRRFLFIRTYLYAVSRAIEEGVDVRGYFYWSLMDNFEWAEGYAMKFGLYAVNFETQERTLRTGSEAYRMSIREAAREA
ncbi:MAG: glycoside hydrolase family 1 protein [Lentisphaeria bacterium]|nr:glycoside hydrolase family 1 protein [Candidatus Neomarinimicrobiota bacterium]MCF7842808.1 glycoside hydrolase family 1 protein [Lentisphaeria bacterium]